MTIGANISCSSVPFLSLTPHTFPLLLTMLVTLALTRTLPPVLSIAGMMLKAISLLPPTG